MHKFHLSFSQYLEMRTMSLPSTSRMKHKKMKVNAFQIEYFCIIPLKVIKAFIQVNLHANMA